MSNWRFPLNPGEIPGVNISIERSPIYATGVQVSSSGKEQRAQFQTYPRYKYHASFEFTRTATGNATFTEFQQLLAMLQMHQGQFDNFLLDDPEDDAVTAHGFGVGDGSTTAFQLQRTMGGPRIDYAGTLAIRNVPATNVVLWDRDLTNAAWTKTNVTAVKDQAGIDNVASSASRITATAGNGTCLQAITLASSQRQQSAYVRRLVGTGTIQMTTDGGSTWTTVTVTSAWTRVSCAAQTLANPSVGFRIVTSGDSIAVDYVQNETGSTATYPIATTTVAVKATPFYFPTYGDGFEPVLDVFGTPTIYKDGTPTTAFTGPVAGTGVITFSVAPASGVVLSWTGTYYRRVRLVSDEMNFTRFGIGYWEQAGLDMVSVK